MEEVRMLGGIRDTFRCGGFRCLFGGVVHRLLDCHQFRGTSCCCLTGMAISLVTRETSGL